MKYFLLTAVFLFEDISDSTVQRRISGLTMFEMKNQSCTLRFNLLFGLVTIWNVAQQQKQN